jgi:hypothetical protein
MNSQPNAARKNGKRLQGTVCRHSPNCEVAQTQKDLQAQVQALSEIVGEGFERVDQRLDQALGRIEQVHGESLTRAKTYIDCNDKIIEMLHRVIPMEG